MAKKNKDSKSNKPRVNPELKGFDITIDALGEIKGNYDIDKINEFLDRNVDDKKLRDQNNRNLSPKKNKSDKKKPDS